MCSSLVRASFCATSTWARRLMQQNHRGGGCVLRTRLRPATWCLTQPGHARCIRAMSRSAAQRLLLVHRKHMYHVIRTHMSNKGSFITSCCSTTKTPTLSPGCACMKERGGGGVDTIVPVERERGTRRESERVREKARECERERERARESERERERARESERGRASSSFKVVLCGVTVA